MMALGRRVAQVLLQLRPSCHHCEIYRWCSAVAQAAAAVIEKSAELLIIYSPYHRIHDARLVRADARASSHVRWCACRRSFYGSMAVASTPHAHGLAWHDMCLLGSRMCLACACLACACACGCRVAPEHVGPINRTVAHAPGRPPASVSSSSQPELPHVLSSQETCV